MVASKGQKTPSSIVKAERLLGLVIALVSSGRPRSKSWIYQNVSGYEIEQSSHSPTTPRREQASLDRKFRRDKKSLREMGIPIHHRQVNLNGKLEDQYFIAQTDPQLPPLQLSDEQKLLLSFATQVWREGQLRSSAQRGLAKLSYSASTPEQQREMTPAVTLPSGGEDLYTLTKAIQESRFVKFTYRNSAGTMRSVSLDPWQVLLWRRIWYVTGWDRIKERQLVFRLDRVVDMVKIGKSGQQSPEVTRLSAADMLLPRQQVQDPPAVLRLAVGRAHNLRLRARTIAQIDDFWDQADIDFRSDWELLNLVAAAGEAVICEQPAEAAEKIMASHSRVVKAHSQPLPNPEKMGARQKHGSGAAMPYEETATDIVARLLTMLPFLARPGGVSFAELQQRFNLDREQIEKDCEWMTVIGDSRLGADHLLDISIGAHHIEATQDQGVSRQVSISADERVTLLAGLQAIAVYSRQYAPAAHELIDLLRNTLKEREHDLLEINEEQFIDPHNVLDSIEQAVHNMQVLQITYWSASRDEVSQRMVKPIAVCIEGSHKYLRAWDHSSAERRWFRIDRVQSVQAQPSSASWEQDLGTDAEQLAGLRKEAEKVETVNLRLLPAGRWFAEYFPVEITSRYVDGSLDVLAHLHDINWLTSQVLSGGGAIIVKSPPSVVEHILSTAARAYDAYVDYRQRLQCSSAAHPVHLPVSEDT